MMSVVLLQAEVGGVTGVASGSDIDSMSSEVTIHTV